MIVDLLIVLMLLLAPIAISYAAVRIFMSYASRSADRALLGSFMLALVILGVFLLYYGYPFPIYCVYLPVGYLVVIALICWVLNEPSARISRERKWHLILPLVGILISAPYCMYILNAMNPFDYAGLKISRAKSEIRNLAVALETYYIDNNTYPPAVDERGQVVPFALDGVPVSSGYVAWMLTTPVVHQQSLPTDPFNKMGRGRYQTYRYATDGKTGWILTSQGPDFDSDMNLANYIRDASCHIEKFLTQYGGDAVEYDPTNGILSSGDVFRTGP